MPPTSLMVLCLSGTHISRIDRNLSSNARYGWFFRFYPLSPLSSLYPPFSRSPCLSLSLTLYVYRYHCLSLSLSLCGCSLKFLSNGAVASAVVLLLAVAAQHRHWWHLLRADRALGQPCQAHARAANCPYRFVFALMFLCVLRASAERLIFHFYLFKYSYNLYNISVHSRCSQHAHTPCVRTGGGRLAERPQPCHHLHRWTALQLESGHAIRASGAHRAAVLSAKERRRHVHVLPARYISINISLVTRLQS
jgi:hypothetical protein